MASRILFATVLTACLAPGARAEPAQPVDPNAAGCVIATRSGIVLVRDTWSRRLSLPGGGLDPGESLVDTAARETLEETGLRVTVGHPVARAHRFVIFGCTPEGAVRAVRGYSHKMERFAPRLTPPAAFRSEIEEVVVADPDELDPRQWRFPSQTATVKQAATMVGATEHPLFVVERVEPVTKLEAWGLSVIRWMQSALDTQAAYAIFRAFSFLGDEVFFYLVLPFFWLCRSSSGGAPIGARLLLLILLCALTNGVTKNLLQLERPAQFDPALEKLAASGFGFPSGHAQLATVFWGFLALNAREALGAWNERFRGSLWALAIGIVFLAGLSRVYFGVHFPHDVAGGWALGAALLALFHLYARRTGLAAYLRGGSAAWIAWAIASAAGLALRPHPETVAVASVWGGVLAGLRWGRTSRESLPPMVGIRSACLRMAAGIGGIFAIVAAFTFATPANRDFPAMLAIQVFQYASMGVWIAWGSFQLLRILRTASMSAPGTIGLWR